MRNRLCAPLLLALVTACATSSGAQGGSSDAPPPDEKQLDSGKAWWCFGGVQRPTCARMRRECEKQRAVYTGTTECARQADAWCYVMERTEKRGIDVCFPDAKTCERDRRAEARHNTISACGRFGDTDVDRATRDVPPDLSLLEPGNGWVCYPLGCSRGDGETPCEPPDCITSATAWCFSMTTREGEASLECMPDEESCLVHRSNQVGVFRVEVASMTGCAEVR